jgi:PBP1b-binding outer membrane lipoprotein LpoB
MRKIVLLTGVCIVIVLISGCSAPNQDEEFRKLVENVSSNFQGQKELITTPYQGVTGDELHQYKTAAISARTVAETMKLSDIYGKARGLLIQGMNSTITAIDTLETTGKLSGSNERVSTDSVNMHFINTQNKINDACDLIGIKREKTY